MHIILRLALGFLVLCPPALAEPLPRIDGLPFDLTESQPGQVTIVGDQMTLIAPAGTDLFNPNGKPPVATAPRITFTPPEGDFIFAVRTQLTFGAAYDGTGLVLWNGEAYWAKLLFESIDDKTAVVTSSFATPVSDNSYHTRMPVTTQDIWLKMVRVKTSVLFYASRDGQTWEILRDLAVDPSKPLSIGVFSQAPLGKALTTQFSAFRFERKTITNYWAGE